MRLLSIGTTFLALLVCCGGQAYAAPNPPANDACATPTVIAALPFTDTIDTTGATVDVGDPSSNCTCFSNPGSVWYQFTPAQDGFVSVDTFGSAFDTVINIWTGTCGAPTEASCDDDYGDSLRSRALVQVTGGTPYLIEITGCSGGQPEQGALTVTVDLVPSPAAGKNFDKCQAALKKNDAKLFTGTLKGAAKCTTALLTCVELKASDPACIAKACAVCGKGFQKYQTNRTALASKTEATCAASLVPFPELMSTNGLGFDNITDRCASDFSGAVTDIASAVDCVQTEHTCAFSQLVAGQMPRAHELLGLCGALPANLGCIPDHGANGGSLADAVAAKALVKCEVAIQKAASAFVVTNLVTLEKCIDAVFTCVQTKPGDDTCIHKGASKGKAESVCSTNATKSQTVEAKLKPAIDKACAGVSMAALFDADGGNFGSLVSICATYGVTLATADDVVTCLDRQHECLTEELGRFAAPRADTLLDLVNIPLHSGFCP